MHPNTIDAIPISLISLSLPTLPRRSTAGGYHAVGDPLALRKRAEGSLRKPGRLDGERAIEARPEVFEGDRGHDLDELRRCEVSFELAKQLLGHVRRSSRRGDGEIQDELLDLRESVALAVSRELLEGQLVEGLAEKQARLVRGDRPGIRKVVNPLADSAEDQPRDPVGCLGPDAVHACHR